MAARIQPKPRPFRDFTIRHDAWEEAPGAHRGLLGFSTEDDFLCIVLAFDPARTTWMIGRARLEARALAASRSVLVEAVSLSPVTAEYLHALGLLDNRSTTLSQEVGHYASRLWGRPRSDAEARLRAYHAGNRTMEAHGHVMGRSGPDTTFAVLRPPGFLCLAEHVKILGDLEDRPIQSLPPGHAREKRHGGTFTSLQKDLGYRRHDREDMVDRGFADSVLKGWRADMKGRLFSDGPDFLAKSEHWSNALANRFRTTGDILRNRVQACRLQPAFFPLVMMDSALLSRVDAGRPFEDLLLERLKGWVRYGESEGLTEAKLRRMRTLSGTEGLAKTRRLLSIVARLPIHHVPFEELGWINFLDVMRPLDGWARRHGLDLPTILSNGPKLGSGRANRWDWSRTLGNIYDMTDMLDRLTETLVGPALPGTDADALARITGRFMLSGMNGPSIERVQQRWHERLQSFEGALPQGRDLVSWPPLLPPYTSPDGTVRITFLTCQSELRQEGGGGPADDEHAGLSHCVGGYARSCYAATSHVASIRKRTPKGWARLSTVEFRRSADSGFEVVQHKGRGNLLPPQEAVQALQGMTEAMRAGAVSVNPDATETRDPSGFRDGIDWSDRSLRESALEAWRPFLQRRHAGITYAGFLEVLREIPST